MAATFFSGFKDQESALNFLLEKIYAGFQMQSSICVVLKDEEHCTDFRKTSKRSILRMPRLNISTMKIYLLSMSSQLVISMRCIS